MQVLKSQVNSRSAEFRANADAMRTLVEDLRARWPKWNSVAGAPLLALEAMQMELSAPRKGVVKAFRFALGDRVSDGAELLEGVE